MPPAVQQRIVLCAKCIAVNLLGAVSKALNYTPSLCLSVLQQSPWGGRGGQHKALSGPRQGPGGWHGHHSPSMSRQGSGSFPSPQHSGFLVQGPSPGETVLACMTAAAASSCTCSSLLIYACTCGDC